jgi:hypothetical protein
MPLHSGVFAVLADSIMSAGIVFVNRPGAEFSEMFAAASAFAARGVRVQFAQVA